MDISHHHRIRTTDVRNKFGWIIDQVAIQKEPVILHRRGRNLAVIIPMEEFLAWEKLVQKEEHRQDIEIANKVLKEDREYIPLEKLQAELGLGRLSSRAQRKPRKVTAAAAQKGSGARPTAVAAARPESKRGRGRHVARSRTAVASARR